MKCVACKGEAKVKFIYAFCKDCFIRHYERRVRRLINKFKLIQRGDRILVAVSGGKDSLSCAEVLVSLRPIYKFELAVLHIDVGIPACTNFRTEEVIRSFCKERDIEFHIIRFKDFLGLDESVDIEELFRKVRRPLCSTCGMLKRYLLNKFAREAGFNKIATGHCADDITKFFLKNWFSQNFDWIAKFKPLTPSSHPKIVSRIRPLFECLEVENLAYVKFKNITIAGCSRCSYFLRKDKWDKLLRFIDEKRPDFKLNIVRGLEYIKIEVDGDRPLNECEICGEPTDRQICSVCTLKERLSSN
jgi:uncharacterized protein (TIGR00269 family)